MNKRKILRATKWLHRLENTQDRFNEAVNELSDEELAAWIKENDLTLEESQTKQRIKHFLVDELSGGDKK